MNTPDSSHSDTRITAPPGTPEYHRQFNRQLSASFAAMFRVGIVRFVCGIFGLLVIAGIIAERVAMPSAALGWKELLVFFGSLLYIMAFAIEALSIAIRGKAVNLPIWSGDDPDEE